MKNGDEDCNSADILRFEKIHGAVDTVCMQNHTWLRVASNHPDVDGRISYPWQASKAIKAPSLEVYWAQRVLHGYWKSNVLTMRFRKIAT